MKTGKQYSKFILILLLALFQTLSCKGPGETARFSSKNEISAESPKIAFLNFSIKNDSIHPENSVRLINKILTDGKLKDNPPSVIPKPNDLKYIVSGNNSKELQTGFIPNPLKQTLEYVTETGQLAKRDIESDSTQFSLRIQLEPGARYFSLKKFTGQDSDLIPLLKIDLIQNN